MLKLLIGKLWCAYTYSRYCFHFFFFFFYFFHQKGFKGYQQNKNRVRKNRCIYMNRIYKFCYNLSCSRNDFYEFHHLLNMGRKDDPVKNNPGRRGITNKDNKV